MKIALIGYGKMGRAIAQLAERDGHEIVLKIGRSNARQLTDGSLAAADVAIEFTQPGAALAHVTACFAAGVPVVCGTTGWNSGLAEARQRCLAYGGAFLQASNFSIGVNIFFELNKRLAALMQHQPAYEVRIEEVHHTEKLDAPSGTAITLAEQILAAVDRKTSWALDGTRPEELPVRAVREAGVPGTHTVTYDSPVDTITMTHTARSRDGFALGALMAAAFLAGRQGIFTMSDVLGI